MELWAVSEIAVIEKSIKMENKFQTGVKRVSKVDNPY